MHFVLCVMCTICRIKFFLYFHEAILTLMEPYTELDERAALVQIWSQKGYILVKWIVSLGAIAGRIYHKDHIF